MRALSDVLNPAISPPDKPPGKPAPGGKWSDFGVRLASTVILAPIVLLALWRGGLAWQALVLVGLLGLAGEWTRLSQLNRGNIVLFAAILTVWVLAAGLGWGAAGVALILFTLVTGWRFGWFAAAGIPYIGIGGFSILWLRLQTGNGLRATLFLFGVIWATDIGAYLAGRFIGGAKLAPRISPGKTWSGSAGGLVIGAIAGAAIAYSADPVAWGIAVAGLSAALLSLCAQAGDLLESWIKRKLGVKDSGRTIPGHGGLFDRLDGFLAAAPVAVILTVLSHHGVPMTQRVMP